MYLLCLLLGAIQPLGWRLVSSADISSKNLDSNERGYSLVSYIDIIYSEIKTDNMLLWLRAKYLFKIFISQFYLKTGKPEDMHTWFFVYDEYMKRDDPENKDVEKQQHHQQQQQQQHQNVSSLNNNKMVEGWNNNKTPVAPPLHHHHPNQHFQQNPQYGATNARGGAMTGRLESRSVPNLDNNASRENTASPPPPPNYTSATQQLKQQSAQHLSNHHTQHPQQYAGKNVGLVSKYTILTKLISYTKKQFFTNALNMFQDGIDLSSHIQ